MRHFLNLHPGPFKMIKSGQKDIEMRLYDERRQHIKIGDEIEFTNNETKEKLVVDVINLYIYPTFDELYKVFPKERLGYLPNEEVHPEDMGQYYSKELRERYSVIGIEIKLK